MSPFFLQIDLPEHWLEWYQQTGINKLLEILILCLVLTGIWELYWLSVKESDDPELLALSSPMSALDSI